MTDPTSRPDRAAMRKAWYEARRFGAATPVALGGFLVGFDDWYDKTYPAATPPEPPNGTVLIGTDGQVWQRLDDASGAGQEWRWWHAGWSDPLPWGGACKRGADPTQVMVSLPSIDSEATLDHLIDCVQRELTRASDTPFAIVSRAIVRATVRTLIAWSKDDDGGLEL